MVPGTFSDKATPDIDFTDEAVVKCNVPVVKNVFADNGNKQIIKINFDVNAQ